MRPISGPLVVGLTAFVCVVALLVSAFSGNDQQTAASRPVAPTPTPEPKEGDKTNTKPKPRAASREDKLRAAVSRFVAAYYRVYPDDTESSRRRRLAKMVPGTVIDRLDLSVTTSTTIDVERIEKRRTQRGTANIAKLRVGRASGSSTDVYVNVPVTVGLVRADESLGNMYETATVSRWRYRDGAWQLGGFVEGDDTG